MQNYSVFESYQSRRDPRRSPAQHALPPGLTISGSPRQLSREALTALQTLEYISARWPLIHRSGNAWELLSVAKAQIQPLSLQIARVCQVTLDT